MPAKKKHRIETPKQLPILQVYAEDNDLIESAPPTEVISSDLTTRMDASLPTVPSGIRAFTEEMIKVPDTWEPQTADIQLFVVAKGCAEYDTVVDAFFSKMTRPAEIVSLERLQNSVLWKFYALTRYRVAMRNSGNPNEKYLYHGTWKRENMDAIINFGFDMRVARNGSAGVGIYFAVHSSYVNGGHMLYDAETKIREMFVCRVAVGSCIAGKRGMVRPPPKSNRKADIHNFYDSVHNGLNVMYTMFDNTQAYPEYIIKYKEVH